MDLHKYFTFTSVQGHPYNLMWSKTAALPQILLLQGSNFSVFVEMVRKVIIVLYVYGVIVANLFI